MPGRTSLSLDLLKTPVPSNAEEQVTRRHALDFSPDVRRCEDSRIARERGESRPCVVPCELRSRADQRANRLASDFIRAQRPRRCDIHKLGVFL